MNDAANRGEWTGLSRPSSAMSRGVPANRDSAKSLSSPLPAPARKRCPDAIKIDNAGNNQRRGVCWVHG